MIKYVAPEQRTGDKEYRANLESSVAFCDLQPTEEAQRLSIINSVGPVSGNATCAYYSKYE